MSNAKRLLAAFAGKAEFMHFDNDRPGGYIPETIQDVEPIIEGAKILADRPPGKDFRHVACIPAIVFDQAAREGWLLDEKKWKQWANDPQNRPFRTWSGRV